MAFTHVRSTATFAAASANTIVSPATAVDPGNILFVYTYAFTDHASGLTDLAGNTFLKVPQPPFWTPNNVIVGDLWVTLYAQSHGANVITAALPSSRGTRGIITSEFTRPGPCGLAHCGGGVGMGTTVSPLAQLRLAKSLAVLAVEVDSSTGTWTAGSGWTTRAQSASAECAFFSRDISAETDVTVGCTTNMGNQKLFAWAVIAEPTQAGGAAVISVW